MTLPVTIDDIREAARLLEGHVVRTPMLLSRTLSEICGCQILLKFENLQFTASFKERGAYVRLISLDAAARRRGVVAMSAGNHAQGVARHARELDIPATIVMPAGTPFGKIAHTRALGARVELQGATVDEAASFARDLGEREGLTFIHPYDDPKIIAGQGTVALEMLEDDPALDIIVCPIGGGGLASGIAVAARALRPETEIVGVQAALYPSMYLALGGDAPAAGAASSSGATIADGIAVKTPGKLTRQIVAALVADILLVGEVPIERAVLLLLEIEKTVAEGAGAAALAAVRENPARFAGKRVGLVLSGGNIDSRLLASICMRGLARDGRLARIRVETADRPGVLARVAAIVGEAGGNIVEVYHQRMFYDVPVSRTEIDFVIETRDREHVDEILSRLAADGWPGTLLGGALGG